MTTYTHRCMIVPKAFQTLAQGLCGALADGSAGEGMFLRAMSKTGAGAATHYLSSGMIDEQLAALLPETVVTLDEQGGYTTQVIEGQNAIVFELAQAAGAKVTQAQIDALFAAVVVSREPYEQALSRLNLMFLADKL